MGIYGYCEIEITYFEDCDINEKNKFLFEVENNNMFSVSIKDNGELIVLSSGRLQNLEYQINEFEKIVKKYKCILSAYGSSMCECDLGLMYDSEGQ